MVPYGQSRGISSLSPRTGREGRVPVLGRLGRVTGLGVDWAWEPEPLSELSGFGVAYGAGVEEDPTTSSSVTPKGPSPPKGFSGVGVGCS